MNKTEIKYNANILEWIDNLEEIDLKDLNIKYQIKNVIERAEIDLMFDKRPISKYYTILDIGYKTKHIVLIEFKFKTILKLYTILTERNKYTVLDYMSCHREYCTTRVNIVNNVAISKTYFYNKSKNRVKFLLEKNDLKNHKLFNAIFIDIQKKNNSQKIIDMITGKEVILTEEILEDYEKGPNKI